MADAPRARRVPAPVVRAGLAVLAVALLNPLPYPRLIPQHFDTARAATERQDYAAAAEALSNVAERLPYDGYALYRAGLADISAENFGSAVRRLLAAGRLDGWSPARRTALGDAYLGLGDREAAVAQWELVRAETPDDDGILARLANTYESMGRYAEAITTLNALARVRGADRSVLYRLALLSAATAPAEAPARLTLVADLAPDLAPLMASLRRAIEDGLATGDQAYTFGRVGFELIRLNEWALAELALSQAVALDPEYVDAHAYLGLAQDMQGKDGRAAYETALGLAPESPLVQFFLGLHWRRQGDSGHALLYLQRAQELDPQNPAIAAEIGGAYASLGDLANAEVWFTQAVSLDEQNPAFWLLLARFYVDAEYHVAELGLPAARMAAGLNPASALAADALGYALVLTGDLANGQKMLDQALALDPGLPSIHYHLGILYAMQGQAAQAEAAFNHTLVLDPDGRYGGLALQMLAQLSP